MVSSEGACRAYYKVLPVTKKGIISPIIIKPDIFDTAIPSTLFLAIEITNIEEIMADSDINMDIRSVSMGLRLVSDQSNNIPQVIKAEIAAGKNSLDSIYPVLPNGVTAK